MLLFKHNKKGEPTMNELESSLKALIIDEYGSMKKFSDKNRYAMDNFG